MGLAIGSHGANIAAARQIEGITSVDFDPNSKTFTVRKFNGFLPILPS